MAALTNASLEYESGQTQYPFAAMTNSGDHKTFSLATKPWSQAAGYEYAIKPFGVINGGNITPAAGAGHNNVDVSLLLASAPGIAGANATTGEITVAAATNIAATRSAVGGTPYQTTSITMNNAGAIVAVSGTVGATQSETRGAAGGPPLIPVDSIELGQVRFSSITAAPVQASEIFATPGVHREMSDQPVFSEDPIRGTVTFAAALPLTHTGNVPKRVMARVATPIFAPIPYITSWKSADTSGSSNSEQTFDGPVGSVSLSLTQASAAMIAKDGITDAILKKRGQTLMFRYKSDKNRLPYQITQGVMTVARDFTPGANPKMTLSITATTESVDFES